MDAPPPILLFVSDAAVLSSLVFALSLRGFPVRDGLAQADPSLAAVFVVDQECRGDGFGLLLSLRAAGCTAPAILLATNPTRALRAAAAGTGATVLEKPLLDDELARILNNLAPQSGDPAQ